MHGIVHGGNWKWNGNAEKPTFTPSILVRGNKLVHDENGRWTGEWERDATGNLVPMICHSFITNGEIRFLDDCTHQLKGKTVPLPEWTE